MAPRIVRNRRQLLSGGDEAGPTPSLPSGGASIPSGGGGLSNSPPASPTTPPLPTGTDGSIPGGTDPNGNGGGHGSGNGNGNGNGNGSGNGSGNGNGNGNGNGGTGLFPTESVTGSPPGTVSGPQDQRLGLSPAAITAILLAVLLVLAVLAVAGRILWRRHRERRGSYHVEALAAGGRPGQGYSNTSFTYDPQMAERLRGGVIEPYNGAASAESLTAQYRIEPFAVPPRRPPHARTPSTARLLDDAAAFGLDAPGSSTRPLPVKSPLPLPTGAMNLQHHGHTFSGLTPQPTPMGTPMTESNMVFELPPTYASLAQPRPVRRWYQFWPPTSGPGGRPGSGNSGSGSRSGSL